MKKLIVLALLALTAPTFAATNDTPLPVNLSSFTITNESLKQLGTTKPGDVLEAVIVSSPTTGGIVTLFDTQGQTGTKIGIVTLSTVQFYPFFVKVSSGVTYTTLGNSNGVTIIYRQR